MAWWAGDGAAPVLAHEPPALLMARAADPDALPRLAFDGGDDAATAILCGVARRLHGHRRAALPELVPLTRWFRSLERRAAEGGLFAAAFAAVAPLLAEPQDPAVLHGDITHHNVLDFGDPGWLAIDPKGLVGERGYDYANLFRSPTLALATPERYRRQLALVSDLAEIPPARLHAWVVGHGALSAVWRDEDGARQSTATALVFVDMVLAQEIGG
jgi:streptomycin 6-kinase